MKTSKVIKQAQLDPPTILESKENTWKVEGRIRPSYWVTRNGGIFYCTCPAGTPLRRRKPTLCRHVTAVVKSLAQREGFDVIQVWTSEEDARKQRRKVVTLEARGTPFWVTLASRWASSYVPDGGRLVKAKRDKWKPGLFDVYFTRDGFQARVPARRA